MKYSRYTAVSLAIAACMGFASFAAFAGSLDISPVRIVLDEQQPIAAVSIHNSSSKAAAVIQVEVLRWERKNGEDVYVPSRDLLVNPPVFSIGPEKTQILRVGLNRPVDETRELGYRVYLQEVSPPDLPEFAGVHMVLRIGLPVFVLPETPAKASLQWNVTRQPDATFKAAVTNSGNAHARIHQVKLATQSETGRLIAEHAVHTYLFPGESAEWILTPKWDWDGQHAMLYVLSDQGIAHIDISVD